MRLTAHRLPSPHSQIPFPLTLFPLPQMKKVIIADQLDLGKEIVANLTEEQLQEIEGGAAAGDATSCWSTSCNGHVVEEAA